MRTHFNAFCRNLRYIMMALLLIASLPAPGAEPEINKQQAITMAEQQYGGQALKAIEYDGAFHIKLLTRDGRVKQVRIDKGSGRELKRKHKKIKDR